MKKKARKTSTSRERPPILYLYTTTANKRFLKTAKGDLSVSAYVNSIFDKLRARSSARA